jgi:hypothetical protein
MTLSTCPPKKFNGLLAPTSHTQTPNEFFDDILPNTKSAAELKVIAIIIRHTFGWQNSKFNQNKNKLSLSDFEELTGLSRQSVNKAIKLTMKRGLIEREEFEGSYLYWLKIQEEQKDGVTVEEEKPKTQPLVKKSYQKWSTNHTSTSQQSRPISREPKETIKKEKETTSSSKKSSSFHPLDRNLEQLNALELDAAQKQTLYENFDDETILNALAYYTSSKKEPDNLGAFLFAACQRKWKPSVKKEVIVKPKPLAVSFHCKPSSSQTMLPANADLNSNQPADVVCKPKSQSISKQNFNPIQELEDLALSEKQKEKIYADFEAENILEGIAWLRGVKNRQDLGASLYDAIRNNYQPKKSDTQRVADNQRLAKKMLGKYEDKIVRGLKIEIFREWVSFSSPTGYNRLIEYSLNHFQDELESICEKLNLN